MRRALHAACFLLLVGLVHAPSMTKANDPMNVALLSHGASAYANGEFVHWTAGPMYASHAIDDDPSTFWAGLQTTQPQRLTVSLGGFHMIDRIAIAENSATSWITSAVVSYHNGHSWYDLLNIAKTSAGADLYFTSVLADSVRIDIHEVDAPSSWTNKVALIYALEVYGSAFPHERNIAAAAQARSNGDFVHWDAGPLVAGFANDGDITTHWDGLSANSPQVLTFEFQDRHVIEELRIWEQNRSSFATGFYVQYRLGLEWHTILDIEKDTADYRHSFSPFECDALRIRIHSVQAPPSWYNPIAQVWEVEILGQPALARKNVALVSNGGSAYSNGEFVHWQEGPTLAEFAIDGDPSTHWDGLQERSPQTLVISFSDTKVIDAITITENPLASWIEEARISYHNGYSWYPLGLVSKLEAGLVLSFTPVLADSVKLEIDQVHAPASWYNQVALVYECEVWGSAFGHPRGITQLAEATSNGNYVHPTAGEMFAWHAIDGDPLTHWDGLEANSPQILELAFDFDVQVDGLLLWEPYRHSFVTAAVIRALVADQWLTVATINKTDPDARIEFAPVVARAMRLQVLEVEAPSSWTNRVALVGELELLGSVVESSTDVPSPRSDDPLVVRVVPNPFNPATAIQFVLDRVIVGTVDVYDVRGALVRRLHSGPFQTGLNVLTWDGTDSDDTPVASGVYLYRVVAGHHATHGKLTLLK